MERDEIYLTAIKWRENINHSLSGYIRGTMSTERDDIIRCYRALGYSDPVSPWCSECLLHVFRKVAEFVKKYEEDLYG